MGGLFITATGTDVGKTYVTCALIRAFKRAGTAVEAYKPVISGFDELTANNSDSGRILAALGRSCDRESIAAISPWRYAAALSPDVAAEREGRKVPFEEVAAFCNEVVRAPGVCLIEGVGGVMSPIDTWRTNRDLIVASRARPLLVAGSYLGTISHILTAVEALHVSRADPVAIVISESEDSPVALDELSKRLAAFVRVPIVGIARDGDVPPALLDLIAAKA